MGPSYRRGAWHAGGPRSRYRRRLACEFGRRLAARPDSGRDAPRTRRRDACGTLRWQADGMPAKCRESASCRRRLAGSSGVFTQSVQPDSSGFGLFVRFLPRAWPQSRSRSCLRHDAEECGPPAARTENSSALLTPLPLRLTRRAWRGGRGRFSSDARGRAATWRAAWRRAAADFSKGNPLPPRCCRCRG